MPLLTPEQIEEYERTGTYSFALSKNAKITKSWYKRGWAVIFYIFAAFFILQAISGSPDQGKAVTNQNNTQVNQFVPAKDRAITNQEKQVRPIEVPKQVAPQPSPVNANTPTDQGLSNNNYYTNTAGNTVHSPAYSKTVPLGASARCRDQSYSFSQSRRGTCSHHGGVAEWL